MRMHSCASSSASRMARAFCWNCRPSSVSSMRRVVRVSRVTPSSASRRASPRLTPEAVCPSSSAAARMEPASTTARNRRRASELSGIRALQSQV
ncbi:Uncharacterised protein [Bordetella pertussis]|nr:Uncharacterised protein [Bordetella pertussis]